MSQEQVRQFIEQATQSVQSGQFDQALRLADQALALDPDSPDAYILKGIGLSQTGQPTAATDAFLKAIALDPNSAKAQYNLAVHYYSQGQKLESLQAARAAAELDATHSAARQLVATVETELGGPSPSATPNYNDPLAQGDTSIPPVQTTPPPASPANPANPVQFPQGPGRYPGPAAPYGEGYNEPVHSLPFVQNMGGLWTGIGWFLVVLDLGAFIFMFAMIAMPVFQAMGTNGDPNALSQKLSSMPGMGMYQVWAWTAKLLVILWTVLDLVNRRGNFVWLIPNVICSCCGFGWVALPIYLLAGRNK